MARLKRVIAVALGVVGTMIVLCGSSDAASRYISSSTKLPLSLYGVPVGTARALAFLLPSSVDASLPTCLELSVDDIDTAAEANLFVNGVGPVAWPAAIIGEGIHAGIVALPLGAVKQGRNQFRFVFANDLKGTTRGFTILKAVLRVGTDDPAARSHGAMRTAGPYRRAVLQTEGLVAYWPLDAVGPVMTEDIAGDHPSTAMGGLTGRRGIEGKCIGFDGRRSAILVDAEPLAKQINGAKGITVEFWIAPGHGLATPQDVMVLRGQENYGSVISLNGPQVSARFRTAKEWPDAVSGNIEPGRFSHLVVSADFENGTLALYVNGKGSKLRVAYANRSAVYGGNNTPTTIGAGNTDLVRAFAGWIDEFAIYRTVLDEAAIRRHYEAGKNAAISTKTESIMPNKAIPNAKRLVIGCINSFCDWCHSYVTPFAPEGLKQIVDWHKQAGVKRIAWRCTDGGTTAYFSKLREPFHGLLPDNCHEGFFMTPDLDKFTRTDFRAWDSFAKVIELAHASGVEVYAWVQVAGEDDGWGYASICVREHPEFCTVGRDGKRFAAKLAWSMPENHEYLLGLLKEILAYKPDGVILDFVKNQGDYRDRLTDDNGVVLYGYEAPAVEAFRRKTGKDAFSVPNEDPEWMKFRAGYVTEFARKARALQQSMAPGVRWIGQTWGGGGTSHFVPVPDAKPGQPRYRIISYPARDELAGNLEDLATWSREGLFDALYPIASTGADMQGFRSQMQRVRHLIKGGKSRLAAGAYIWGMPQCVPEIAYIAANEFSVKELYLAEAMAFHPDGWPSLKVAQEYYGK